MPRACYHLRNASKPVKTSKMRKSIASHTALAPKRPVQGVGESYNLICYQRLTGFFAVRRNGRWEIL